MPSSILVHAKNELDIIIGWLQEIIKQLKIAEQFWKRNLKGKPLRNRFQLMVNGLAEKPD